MEGWTRDFYLFRRKRDNHEGYEYIQFLQSPSYRGGLTLTCWPEYAWRGTTQMDMLKMKAMINMSHYRDKGFELVKYNMDYDTPSWAKQPEPREYECLPIGPWERLTPEQEKELEEYETKMRERYGND